MLTRFKCPGNVIISKNTEEVKKKKTRKLVTGYPKDYSTKPSLKKRVHIHTVEQIEGQRSREMRHSGVHALVYVRVEIQLSFYVISRGRATMYVQDLGFMRQSEKKIRLDVQKTLFGRKRAAIEDNRNARMLSASTLFEMFPDSTEPMSCVTSRLYRFTDGQPSRIHEMLGDICVSTIDSLLLVIMMLTN